MSLFFNRFHSVNELLENFADIAEAAAALPESDDLEARLDVLRRDFRAYWLAGDTCGPAEIAGWLQKLLRQAASFSQAARRLRRFDLEREIAALAAKIGTCRPFQTASLPALLARPSYTPASLSLAY